MEEFIWKSASLRLNETHCNWGLENLVKAYKIRIPRKVFIYQSIKYVIIFVEQG